MEPRGVAESKREEAAKLSAVRKSFPQRNHKFRGEHRFEENALFQRRSFFFFLPPLNVFIGAFVHRANFHQRITPAHVHVYRGYLFSWSTKKHTTPFRVACLLFYQTPPQTRDINSWLVFFLLFPFIFFFQCSLLAWREQSGKGFDCVLGRKFLWNSEENREKKTGERNVMVASTTTFSEL